MNFRFFVNLLAEFTVPRIRGGEVDRDSAVGVLFWEEEPRPRRVCKLALRSAARRAKVSGLGLMWGGKVAFEADS